MNKQTFSHFGAVVAAVIVLAIMVAFATPFADYVAGSSGQAINSFSDKSNSSLSAASNKEYRFAAMRGLFQTLVLGATDQTGESLKYDTVETTDDSLREGLVAFTSGEVDEINIKNASLFVVDVDGEFETATLNFDVSGLAREGERVAVYHYNETLGAWEYITTCDVGADRQITATFASLSPVALVNVTRDYAAEHNITGPVKILIPNVITKYGGWIVLIDAKALQDAYGDAVSEDYVFWYRIVGNKDTESNETDDVYLGSGYYYTEGDRLAAGCYYCVVIIPESEQYPNGAVGSTEQCFSGSYVDPNTAENIDLSSVGQTTENNSRVEINASTISESHGIDIDENNVTWYKVVGERDTDGEESDDQIIGSGYGYSKDNLTEGEYYAVVEVLASEDHPDGVYGTTESYVVETDGTSVEQTSSVEVEILSKYGDRLIMLNKNALEAQIGAIDDENDGLDVVWYKVVGKRDVESSQTDDVNLGSGYYYTREDGSPLETGKYYAVVTLPDGTVVASNVLTVVGNQSEEQEGPKAIVVDIAKYNNSLIMINRRNIINQGIEMPETVDDRTAVLWYKVVGNKDTDCDEEDDELLVNGYYYAREDGSPLETGKYYAVVSISESESLPHGAYGVSDLLVIANDAP